MVLIDTVIRLLPGVLGDERSSNEDSYSGHERLLEFAQYTRPREFRRNWECPEVLLSGNHGEIARWRKEQSIAPHGGDTPPPNRRRVVPTRVSTLDQVEVPAAGCVMPAKLNASPSASQSFASTSIEADPSCLIKAASSTAVGESLTELTVIETVAESEVDPSPAV